MSPTVLYLAADTIELLSRLGWTLLVSLVLFAALGAVVIGLYAPRSVSLRPSDDWQPMPVIWGGDERGER